jgi:hypothetical protein
MSLPFLPNGAGFVNHIPIFITTTQETKSLKHQYLVSFEIPGIQSLLSVDEIIAVSIMIGYSLPPSLPHSADIVTKHTIHQCDVRK